MDLALQRELFSEVLDELDINRDLTNQILTRLRLRPTRCTL